MKSCVLDFKVFEGRTIGELCGEDVLKIFDDYNLNKENTVIVVTGTTGNMIAFSNKLRVEILIEYAFCVDHNLCRNYSKASDGMCIVLSFPNHYYNCNIFSLISDFLLFLDTNMHRANRAMKAVCSIIKFFSKLT